MRMFRVVVNGNEYKVGIEELAEEKPARTAPPSAAQAPRSASPKAAPQPEPPRNAPSAGGDGRIVAPMPGTIQNVSVSAGDRVSKGQTLLVLEAMKMENEILAPADCLVEEVSVSKGVSVNVGDILVIVSS